MPYNDLDAAAAAVERYGEGLAAILVEPVAGNMGVVPPVPGFLEALRALCDASGALLVFDEVITGFRVARGGAQERYGVLPDLTILGKIVGGGLPLAAFGGRADVMERLAPAGDVYQAGTLSGQPARDGGRASRCCAGCATRPSTRSSRRRARGSRRACAGSAACSASARWRRSSAPTAAIRSFADAKRCDTERYGALFRHLLERGIYVAPSQFECLFVSLAHGDDEIDRTVEAVGDFFAPLTSGTSSRRGAAAESPLWADALRPSGERRGRLLAARPGAVRARPRDDLRGLPRPLRAPAAVRARRRGRRAPARRLPLRARARPDRHAGDVDAVAALAELISRCAALRAASGDGDGAGVGRRDARRLGGERRVERRARGARSRMR